MGKKILTNLEVKGYIDVDGGIKDANSNFGSSGQVLKSGGTGVVNWANESGGSSSSVDKFVRGVLWSHVQTNVSYSGNVCTVTHGLGSSFVHVSIVDVSGAGYSDAGANGYVDIDYIAHVKVVDSNNISFEMDGTAPSYGNSFNITVTG